MRYQLIIDLAGNLQTRAQQMGRSMQGFAQSGERHMGRLRAAVGGVDRGIEALGNRYTAFATGVAGGAAIKFVGDLDTKMRQFAVNTGKTLAELAPLKQQVFEVAAELRIDPGQVLAGLDQIVVKTGDLALAEENVRNVGRAIAGMGVLGQEAGAIVANLYDQNRIRAAEDVLRALDTIQLQGKAGSITGGELAGEANASMAAYGRLGRGGISASVELGAVQQMTIKAVGSAAEATTAIASLIEDLQDATKVKKLKAAGVRLMEDDGKTYRALPEIMKDLVTRTGGDMVKLSGVFSSTAQKALAPVAAEFRDGRGFASLDGFMQQQANADGSTLIADAKTMTDGWAGAMNTLTTAAQRFADTNLSAPVQDLAEALNSLTVAQQDMVLGTIAAVGVGSVAYVGAKRLGGLFGIGRGRGGAGGGPAAGGLGGLAGPTPVVVMNWPVGMMGGMAGGGGSPILGPDGQPMRKGPGAPRPAARGWRGAAAGLAARGGSMVGGLMGRSGALAATYYGGMAVANLAQGDVKGAASEGGAGVGALSGAALGAKGGALIGTMIMPGVGTAVGGAIGAMGGAVIGSEAGRWIADELAEAVSKGWDALTAEQKPQVVEGKVAVEFGGLPPGSRVTSVSSKGGLELDVDAGLMMGAP